MVIAFVAVALLAASQGSSAPAQDAWLQRVLDRGKSIYLYDQAAWVTSDDAATRVSTGRQAEVDGWVVTEGPNGLHVDYFGKDKAAERVVYSADVSGGKIIDAQVFAVSAEPALTEPALRMARALRLARSELRLHPDWHPCARAPFNTVVLPPQRDGTIPVYLLTPQTDLNSVPFGGHYEIDIAPNGTTSNTRAFTNSCLTMPKPPFSLGSTPAALFVTHLLDPHPTEIHVYEQYVIGLPVLVGTGLSSVWMVNHGSIEDVSSKIRK